METSLTQRAPVAQPWHRPFWKPVHGKEGVFTYLILIHVLSLIGLILFPLPSLKVLVLFAATAGPIDDDTFNRVVLGEPEGHGQFRLRQIAGTAAYEPSLHDSAGERLYTGTDSIAVRLGSN